MALTWNQSWNRHSEHPNIRRVLFVEEPIIHEVLDHTSSQEHQKEYWPFSKKEDYNKDSNKSEGTVQQCIKLTVSRLELCQKNESLTQVYPVIRLESSRSKRSCNDLCDRCK